MTFVRRSRKGRIHVVRGRIAGGYMKLSKGLMRANQSVIGGVRQTHKGLQLGLAKGHQAIQSGLKGIQDISGDFNQYYSDNTLQTLEEKSMGYYQYEPPVAMFSMAEVDTKNKYQNGNQVASFAKDPFGPGPGWRAKQAVKGAAKGTARVAGNTTRVVGTTLGRGFNVASRGAQAGGNLLSKGLGTVGSSAIRNPLLAGGLALGAAAAGAGGATFMRRRRSKNGKIIVENVRR